MLDTLHPVQTPEGVDLNLRAAGPVPRALAWGVDALLRAALLAAAGLGLVAFGAAGMGVLFIVTFAVWWFYPVAFEVLGRGATPGKRVMGLVVLHEDGTPVGWPASLLRNLLRVVDFLPFLYVAGLCTMLIDASFRRLGDLAAGTLVVYAERVHAAAAEVPKLLPLAPPIPLTLDEQRAVIAFAERAPFLSPARAAELAAIPEPLAGNGGDPVERLMRMAAWLVGRSG
jgi:uncharacterized RDD family membrane protein YckC